MQNFEAQTIILEGKQEYTEFQYKINEVITCEQLILYPYIVITIYGGSVLLYMIQYGPTERRSVVANFRLI